MKQHILSRFELLCLDFTIRSLSRSRLTRSFLAGGYELMHQSRLASLSILMVLSGMGGLLSGCLIYLVIYAGG